MHIDAIPFAPKNPPLHYGSNRSDGCAIVVNSDVEIPRIKVPMNGGLFIPFGNDPPIVFTPQSYQIFKPTVQSMAFQPLNPHRVMGYDWKHCLMIP